MYKQSTGHFDGLSYTGGSRGMTVTKAHRHKHYRTCHTHDKYMDDFNSAKEALYSYCVDKQNPKVCNVHVSLVHWQDIPQ